MDKKSVFQGLFCFALGVATAYCLIASIGMAMAISIPKPMIEWMQAASPEGLGVFVWNLMMFGIGAAMPTFVVLLLVYRFLVVPTVFSALLFLLGMLTMRGVLMPLFEGSVVRSFVERPWTEYALELVVLAAVSAALAVSRYFRAVRAARASLVRHPA